MDLPALWRDHQVAPFPHSCLKLSVGGAPLAKLDAEAGASLTASLRTDGVPRPLSADRRLSLSRCLDLVRQAARDLPLDPEGSAYFRRLEALAAAVLAANPP